MDDLTTSFPIISNRYQVFSTIATGGMAVIYEAQDIILERKVALKILKRELSEDPSFQNKFRSEAKASANLNHPNIVTTYDFGFDKDRLYIVMEFIEGMDLKEWIRQQPSVNPEKSLDYLKQASRGLSYAHSSGFVHCDVKPQNMLLDVGGGLKITDFGVARAIETITRDEKYSEVWGSPYYISPEQTRGDPPTTASDVYALGVIAYELMTGTLPFSADNTAELLQMHRVQEPLPPIKIAHTIPASLNNLILEALSKDPSRRPKDASAFLESLKKIQISRGAYASEVGGGEEEQSIESIGIREIPNPTAKKDRAPVDTGTILLSLLALITVGGLIPFWIYVFFSINTPGR